MRLPALASLTLVFAAPAHADVDEALKGLKPHRAVYDVKLLEASERSGIRGIKGRIVYELTGSVCEGFAAKFRFFQQVRAGRRDYTSDQRTTSYEGPGGDRFEFVNRTFFNGRQEKEVRGKARRENGELAISVEKPEEAYHDLADAAFSTSHLAEIIDAAKRGETIFSRKLYDGSGDGNEVTDTTSIIGKRRDNPAAGKGENEAEARSVAAPWWPVTVSFFKASEDRSTEKLPTYQATFAMHESGVSRDLTMRFEDFALTGKLTDVEFLEQETCE